MSNKMLPKQITFVDAFVLINAVVGSNAARKMRTLSVLGDSSREFAASRFLKLEVLPIPFKYRRRKESAFYERFFAGITVWVDDDSVIQPAYDLACQHGLGAVDALHIAAAIAADAEFISAEKPTKPLYGAYSNTASIY